VPKEDLEHLKYGQDVSSKIWLALVTALFGIYFGKDIPGMHGTVDRHSPNDATSLRCTCGPTAPP
jgi:hypothetical protein